MSGEFKSNEFSPRTTILTSTTGSGLKQRIRELEALIDNDLKNAQLELEALKKSRQISPENTKELFDKAKNECIDHFENSKQELKKFFVNQRQENVKLHELIKMLRNENATLQQSILALQRRLQAIEEDIGQ